MSDKQKAEINQLRKENRILQEIIGVYQEHLVKVIEHNTIEKYRIKKEKQ